MMPRLIQISLFRLLIGFKPKRRNKARLRFSGVSPASLPSDTTLKVCWDSLIDSYFPERQELKSWVVKWSARRQKRTLGSCCISKHRVNIARELRHLEASRWIEAVIFHELCHAVLGKGVGLVNGKRSWHGREFRELERRHHDIEALNLWIKSGGWRRAVRVDRASRAKKGTPTNSAREWLE